MIRSESKIQVFGYGSLAEAKEGIMAGVNKVILIGHLGADPEARYSNSGTAVVNFRMATSETRLNKAGEKTTLTEWHRIVAFGKLAEICRDYLAKGKQVYIEGRLRTRTWEDKDGNRKYTTEIVASQMQMLGAAGGQVSSVVPERGEVTEQEPPPIHDDEVPF